MDIILKINRILGILMEGDIDDEYNSLKDQLHAALAAGKKTLADLLRKKMGELRIKIVTHRD